MDKLSRKMNKPTLHFKITSAGVEYMDMKGYPYETNTIQHYILSQILQKSKQSDAINVQVGNK